MDYEFPSVLFPSFYNNEPPVSRLGHCAGSWGSYGQLRTTTPQEPSSVCNFKPKREVHGEIWRQTEPVSLPLQLPKKSLGLPLKNPDPLDFSQHLQNVFMDHYADAFGTTANLLGDKLYFKSRPFEYAPQEYIKMWKISHFMDVLKYKKCRVISPSAAMDAYSLLLYDSVHSIPVELLGSLFHEELSLQKQRTMLDEDNTGGALDFISFSTSSDDSPQSGCLVNPANGVDKLSFQMVALQHDAVVCSNEACSFFIKGPILQINSSSLCGYNCVAVRSLYNCGVWRMSSTEQPHLLQAISSNEKTTCISVSPHVLGEVLVASESGAVHLWTLGQGMQLIRREDCNLYFNAQSSWRWCDFSAHPRVVLYADRTGLELTDTRMSSYHTLFRISQVADCCSGERLLTCRYLSGAHSFHHLVSTQYSAYIMDERFPCVPMLKLDHMMEGPPLFCHVLPGSGLSCDTTKILLGSQSSQEITLLQYSGGGLEACVQHGPPQALLRPRDNLGLLPVQIPHRTQVFQDRLACPASGLASVPLKRNAFGERFCVFQLLQTGDVFYQILEKDTSPAQAQSDVNCASSPKPTRGAEETPEVQGSTSSRMEQKLSQESLSIWKCWLQKLAKDCAINKSEPLTVKNNFKMSRNKTKESAQCRKLQQDFKNSLSSSVSCTEELVPMTDHVHAETWTDDLSSRLTTFWDNEVGWHAWWAEHLGSNKAKKAAAFRRKRQQKREARRACENTLLALSGSFTLSSPYQSELSEFSDSSGLLGSYKGGVTLELENPPTVTCEEQRLSSMATDTEKLPPNPPVETPTTSVRRPQHIHSQTLSQESLSFPLSVKHTPASSSKTETLSRSQPSTQSSLGRQSQLSQPKKKSRMGF